MKRSRSENRRLGPPLKVRFHPLAMVTIARAAELEGEGLTLAEFVRRATFAKAKRIVARRRAT